MGRICGRRGGAGGVVTVSGGGKVVRGRMRATRRYFFGALGAVAASKAAADSANSTIDLGLIGCGARGRGVIVPNFGKMPGVRFTAVCDVNSKYGAEDRVRSGGERVAAYAGCRAVVEHKKHGELV